MKAKELRIRTDTNLCTIKVEGKLGISKILGNVLPYATEKKAKEKNVKIYFMDDDMKLNYEILGGVLSVMLYKGYQIIVEK